MLGCLDSVGFGMVSSEFSSKAPSTDAHMTMLDSWRCPPPMSPRWLMLPGGAVLLDGFTFLHDIPPPPPQDLYRKCATMPLNLGNWLTFFCCTTTSANDNRYHLPAATTRT